ncbi:hypothetical protein [Mycolicibacterium sp.]|uniref:hypothetical protein n=1 Tax=Mycolicibacterium sp. TaxID=2320850 RepID=UPI0037CAF508
MRSGPPLDCTTALFLDLHHSSSTLPRWDSLTGGVPAALREPRVSLQIAASVAMVHGAEAGLVSRSTLHALIDIFGGLPRNGDLVVVDEAVYPTTRCAVRIACRPGVSVRLYQHHQPATIPRTGNRMLVVTDGWCSGCNRSAPLGELRDRAGETGRLVVDDSLAFGILGRRGPGNVFGDGSGTAHWSGLDHRGVVWVASFAKAYGSPIAVTTGSAADLSPLRTTGNRLHSSPPSIPDLYAAHRALSMTAELSRRRARLATVVSALRAGIATLGLPVLGLPFPVIGIPLPLRTATSWWQRLRAVGIEAIVQIPRCHAGALLSFVARSEFTPSDVGRIVSALGRISESRVSA